MEQDKKYTWDLTKFCKDIPDCEQKLQEILDETSYLLQFKGKLGNPQDLLLFWQKYFETYDKACVCLIYVNATLDTNMGNEDYQILKGKLDNTLREFDSAMTFVAPEL